MLCVPDFILGNLAFRRSSKLPPLAKKHLREITMVAPSKFAHVVFNTHRYDEMIDWYAEVFEARVQHRNDRLAFLTYDDEHHRFAFVNLGPAKDSPEKRPAMALGLNHLGYTWRNLAKSRGADRHLRQTKEPGHYADAANPARTNAVALLPRSGRERVGVSDRSYGGQGCERVH